MSSKILSRKILQTTVYGILLTAAGTASAVPFNSFDPRSFGMGGTGVASGTSANAGFMNPALLAAANKEEDFSLELPIVGGRLMDRDNLMDEVDAYQDSNLEANLTTAIDIFSADPSNNTKAAAVATEADALLTQLNKMSNKAIQGELSGGFVIGVPSKKIGAALTVNAWAVGGGLLDVTSADNSLVGQIITDGNNSAATLATNSDIVAQAGGTDVVTKLTSAMFVRGAVIQEVSLALAREYNVGGHDMAFGITPKYLKVTTFDYQVGVNTADFETDQGKKEYSDFNLDLGVAKDFANGWKSGFVVKNIIAQEYQTVLGNTIKIEPQARLGVAHSTDWTTVAFDVDLNESEATGFDSKTQYAGFGVELDVWDTLQLRGGYRHNMSDSDTSIVTVGVGLSPFGVHIDVAATGSDDEVGGSVQMGFRF